MTDEKLTKKAWEIFTYIAERLFSEDKGKLFTDHKDLLGGLDVKVKILKFDDESISLNLEICDEIYGTGSFIYKPNIEHIKKILRAEYEVEKAVGADYSKEATELLTSTYVLMLLGNFPIEIITGFENFHETARNLFLQSMTISSEADSSTETEIAKRIETFSDKEWVGK